MKVQLLGVRAMERMVRLRFPFRFGIISLEEAPQMFVEARVRTEDGREGVGVAAEMLAPKWFDKNPELSNEENFDQLREAVRMAARNYLDEPGAKTTFRLFVDNYARQIESGAEAGMNPLVSSFGPALLDRAVLDGLCRLMGLSFQEAIGSNLPGLSAHPLIDDLEGLSWSGFLSGLRPLEQLHARHTVGLGDPITDADLNKEDRLDDGLPETLEEVIATYGNRYFKVKVCGDLDADLARLEQIAAVLERSPGYRITLDGNEQFSDMDRVAELCDSMRRRAGLDRFWEAILFLEQPVHRDKAFEARIDGERLGRAVIIDESDQELEAFLRARDRGYLGVSSKSCKGFYKSLINRARCRLWNEAAGRETFFMSGEDLSTQPGLALQQDLALVSVLGIDHVERNGHHYVAGFCQTPLSEQQQFLRRHPGLYTDADGLIRLAIRGGRLDLRGLEGKGFASGVLPAFAVQDLTLDLQR